MNKYWQKRIQQNEDKAVKLAETYSKRQQAAYRRAYKKVEAELNRFFADVESGTANRTQFWNYLRYQTVLETIAAACQEIGVYQLSLMDGLAAKVFEDTLGATMEDLGKSELFKALNTEDLMKVVLNSEWSGNSYSKRIWNNTNRLAAQIQSQIESLVAIGKNPDEIKAELMRTFNSSYSAADRLVRTEASYVYNTAAIEGYKEAGCQEVEFLAEADCCDECKQYRGKKFGIDQVPMIPIHPNCRCTYVPIVD